MLTSSPLAMNSAREHGNDPAQAPSFSHPQSASSSRFPTDIWESWEALEQCLCSGLTKGL